MLSRLKLPEMDTVMTITERISFQILNPVINIHLMFQQKELSGLKRT